MRLSTNTTTPLALKYGPEKVIGMIKTAGFDAYDFSMDTEGGCADFCLDGEDTVAAAKRIRAYADSIGIPCNQAHAPFPSSTGDNEKDARMFDMIVASMEFASILGAEIIVVHPKQHLPWKDNKELLREMNIEFYTALLPYCEKYGIKIATENMWQFDENRTIIDSTCSSHDEFNDYIDSIGSPYLVGCLDIGHIPLVRRSIGETIRGMGNSRIRALHVHDNNKLRDFHLLPFTMINNFEEMTDALRDIGYDGDFTFEADTSFIRTPIEILPKTYELAEAIGRYLIAKIEEKNC